MTIPSTQQALFELTCRDAAVISLCEFLATLSLTHVRELF